MFADVAEVISFAIRGRLLQICTQRKLRQNAVPRRRDRFGEQDYESQRAYDIISWLEPCSAHTPAGEGQLCRNSTHRIK